MPLLKCPRGFLRTVRSGRLDKWGRGRGHSGGEEADATRPRRSLAGPSCHSCPLGLGCEDPQEVFSRPADLGSAGRCPRAQAPLNPCLSLGPRWAPRATEPAGSGRSLPGWPPPGLPPASKGAPGGVAKEKLTRGSVSVPSGGLAGTFCPLSRHLSPLRSAQLGGRLWARAGVAHPKLRLFCLRASA